MAEEVVEVAADAVGGDAPGRTAVAGQADVGRREQALLDPPGDGELARETRELDLGRRRAAHRGVAHGRKERGDPREDPRRRRRDAPERHDEVPDARRREDEDSVAQDVADHRIAWPERVQEQDRDGVERGAHSTSFPNSQTVVRPCE
ncbi:MAG: hypothetical protein OXH69_23405 [Acidobacteria bacterium]|nr:hypothetical protein [Acidobacteriota bacterium]